VVFDGGFIGKANLSAINAREVSLGHQGGHLLAEALLRPAPLHVGRPLLLNGLHMTLGFFI
jgi:hypothetical protein